MAHNALAATGGPRLGWGTMRTAILAGTFTVLVTAHVVRGEGNLTTRSGECIYHVRGGAFYERTKPEVCFATHEDARRYGWVRRSVDRRKVRTSA